MQPSVRIARREDLPAIVALHRVLNPDDPAAPPERLEAVFGEILSSSYFDFVVAEWDGAVAGTCYLNIVPNLTRDVSPYAIVENVVVALDIRRRGIGKALVRFALERAWQRGCYKAMLQAGARNEGRLAFYRRCGFDQGERAAFVARPPRGSAPAS